MSVATTVELNSASPTISTLNLSHSTSGFTIAPGTGGGVLNFSAGAGTAAINVSSGNHEISAPVYLASEIALNVSGGVHITSVTPQATVITPSDSTLTFSGTISSNLAAPAVHVNGGGTVTVGQTASFAFSNPGTINVNAGTLNLNTANGTNNLSVNVGTSSSTASAFFGLATGTNIALASLNVNDGSLAVLGSGTGAFGMHSVMTVNNLNLNSTGVLDLNDNGLILTYTDPSNSPLATIQSLIAAGRIKSSLSDANNGLIGVGYLEASDVYAAGAQFPWKGGVTLAGNPANGGAPTAILVLPTILGDTNLNGVVDLNDLGNAIGYFPMDSGATWENGDTDNNGTVDINDLGNVIGYYPSDMVSLGFWPADAFDASVGSLSSVGGGTTVVPEPTTLVLLALGGLAGVVGGSIRRRRHAARAAA